MEFSILNLLLVLLVAWLAGQLAARVGYPSVLGELLAGILLGPPLLGLLEPSAALSVLAEVGILLMMLYIGMEIDPAELGKASWAGLLAALGGFITPFVLCYLLMVAVGATPMAAIFVGIAAGVTSLATKSRILVDLRLLDTRIAHVMMAGALIADTLSLVIFAGVLGVAEVGALEVGSLALVLAKALLFFAVAAFVGLKVLPLAARRLRGLSIGARFTLVILVGLLFAEGAELAGMHGILGAFLAGLFLRESVFGRSAAHDLMKLVQHVSIGFLAPIFFVTAGFAVSLDVFSADLGLLLGVIGLATAGKIVGTALFYLPTGNGWREGVTLGAGMNGRGAVEIIIAQIALSMGLIDAEVFSILVFMAIATTAMVPLFLKWGSDWLRRRGELVRATHDREGAVIVGAGPVARALGEILGRSEPVTVVDRSPEQCAFAEASGLRAVQGDALDEEVLSQAGAAKAKYFIACTPNAEVNALAAREARHTFLVPDVLLLTSDVAPPSTLRDHLSASPLFGGGVHLSDWDYRLDQHRAERNGLALTEAVRPADLFQRLQEHRDTLPLALRRGDQYLPFHGEVQVEAGDRVIFYQTTDAQRPAFDRFDRLVTQAPVLDFDRERRLADLFDDVAAALAPRLDMEPEELATKLMERETLSHTVLLPGLAIPHVIVEGSSLFEIALVRCREGIDFPGEKERVHAAFVLAGTSDERNFHLRALSAIAQIVQWSDFEQRWLLASDAEALRRLVLRAARRRFPEESVSPVTE